MRPGALTGLTSGQRAELRRRVAEHLGTAVIARPGGRPSALALILRRFRIHLSLPTIGKYLHSCGLSPWRPIRRACEQNRA